jgi:hypothetical protein
MRRQMILAALLMGAVAQAQEASSLGKSKLGDAVGTEQTVTTPVTAGEGNMPAGFYPKSPCEKPDKKAMGSPPEATNQPAMQAYNAKVKTFNQKAVAFNDCMKTYVAKAQNDIKTIQDTVHDAVADANAH